MKSLELDFSSLYCLFKGEPGTRKSTAALSFPKPIYFFDWDGKMDALTLPARNWNIPFSDIQYDSYQDWNAGLSQLERFQMKCPFKTIVIDSITSCADGINRQTLKVKSGQSGTGKQVAGIPVNSIEDFNAEDSALKELIAITKNIRKTQNVNIILIAHVIQKEVKDAQGKTHMSRTLVTAGKGIAQKIPAYCSEVYHFNIDMGLTEGSGKYALFTQHMGDDFARTSLPLPEKIVFGNEPLYDRYILPSIQKITTNQKDGVDNASNPVQQTGFASR